MKVKKRKKSSRYKGKGMGTVGSGARKKNRKSGHRGGKGMSGSGKRADHKKTLVTKLYGGNYFGKKGITSIGSKRDKRDRINLQQINSNPEKYGKKEGDKFVLNLLTYKILGTGEINKKLIIKAKEASKSAIEKVKKAGGEIQLPQKVEKKKVEKVVEKKSVKEKN